MQATAWRTCSRSDAGSKVTERQSVDLPFPCCAQLPQTWGQLSASTDRLVDPACLAKHAQHTTMVPLTNLKVCQAHVKEWNKPGQSSYMQSIRT